MKQFITMTDIDSVLLRNEKTIVISPQDVVTSAARDYAQSKGISFSVAAESDNAPVFAQLGTAPAAPMTMPQATAPQAQKRPAISVGPFKGSLSDADIEKWREEFPILKTAIHVGNCSQSAQSKRVRAAINRYLDNWLSIGMDWDYWMQEIYLAKVEFAKLINADPEEIAISTSVSEAINSIAGALDYSGSRSRVVTTEAEFPTVGHIWLSRQRLGVKVDYVPLHDYEIHLEDYERFVDERTLITSVTHVFYQNGFKQDLDAIVDICHKKGSLVLVDDYQSTGTHPIDVKKSKIDILTTGNLKYLFGIPGIAFLYVNKALIPHLKPTVTGWFGQENPFSFQVRVLDYACDARRFDTGTPPVMAGFAVRAGMEIVNEVGVPAIKERIDYLSTVALEASRALGLKTQSPWDVSKKGGTTAIELKMDSHLMELELKKRNIIGSARGNVIRVAPHFYTKPEEIVYVMEQIKEISDKNGH